MTPRSHRLDLLAVALLIASCDDAAQRATEHAALAKGVAAEVGTEVIDVAAIELVARDTGKSPAQAREALIHDAVFASAARADEPEDLRRAETTALARAMMHALTREAREKPIEADELENWRMARFLDVDRPEGFRVIHIVVLVDAAAPAALARAARSHATDIRERVAALVAAKAGTSPPTRTGEDIFLERTDIPEDPIATAVRDLAQSMTRDDLETRYESLGVVSEDGRLLNYARSPWDRLHPAFSRASAQLARRGDVSPVVETELEVNGKSVRGLHVIALLERTPPKRSTPPEQLRALTPIIHDARTQKARKNLLETLAVQRRVVLERSASSRLEELDIGAPSANP